MPRGFLVRRYLDEPVLDLSYQSSAPLDLSLKSLTPPPTPPTRARPQIDDEDFTSPVSGTLIRKLSDTDEPLVLRKGDIDPAYNIVRVTDEAKAELAKIENKIGDYVCRLCKEVYDDPFGLAGHRCSRIVHIEYKCPECGKVFNCPANLASHRRWHRPREEKTQLSSPVRSELLWSCDVCGRNFKKQAYLKKHLASHPTVPYVIPKSCCSSELTKEGDKYPAKCPSLPF